LTWEERKIRWKLRQIAWREEAEGRRVRMVRESYVWKKYGKCGIKRGES